MHSSRHIEGPFQARREDRLLLLCLLASIALHAAVLFGIPGLRASAQRGNALSVLTATLMPRPAAPIVSPQPAKLPERPVTHPAPRPALAKVAAVPIQDSKPAVAPTVPAPTEAPAAAPSAPAAAPSAAAKPAPQPSGALPAPEPPSKVGTELDAGTLEQYRLALIVATRRYKRYPAIAMEKGWQGRVEVHMVIGANGMIASASIKASSGHEILDNQALDMLKKGKTTVPIPTGLRGKDFSVDVPVIFNLDNRNT